MLKTSSQHIVDTPPEITVVVPVYQSARCIEELLRRLHQTLEKISPSYEILLVDDGSKDDSWQEIKKFANNKVKGICLSRNFGQHYAISAGIDASRGNWVVVMDCDLQDPPEVIGDLYAKAHEGYPVVFARKQKEENISFFDRLTSRLFYICLGLISPVKVDEGLTNFSIASRQVIDTLCTMRDRLRFYGGMIFWSGFNYAVIDYVRAERHSGQSNYNFRRRFRLAIKNIFAYSTVPLEYCTYIGLGVMFLSLAYMTFAFIGYFLHNTAPSGWTSLVILIGFFGGFLSFQLGIIGLYIGQLIEETRRRPLYVVSETASLQEVHLIQISKAHHGNA